MKAFWIIIWLPLLLLPGPEPQPASSLPICPPAVHDRYSAVGPGGQKYPTWHPPVDVAAGCVFDHEHGSDPSLLRPVPPGGAGALLPLFGYSAAKMGMSEGHAGFKVYVVDPGDGYRLMITHHFGTASASKAACIQMHTFDLVIVDARTFERLIELHLMGDFGRAAVNETNGDLFPAACPNQAAQARASGSNGVRQFPLADSRNVGYEPWRLDNHLLPAVGFGSGSLTINTYNPVTSCDTISCTASVPRLEPPTTDPARGTYRFVTFNTGLQITGVVAGTFFTDPTGRQSRTGSEADAVAQYIKPGFSYHAPGPLPHCWPYGTLEYLYWCSSVSSDAYPFRHNTLITGPN